MGNDARGAAEARSEGSLAVGSTKASLRGSVLKDVSGNQPEAGCGGGKGCSGQTGPGLPGTRRSRR